MAERTNNFFMNEICSKLPERKFNTNKTNVYHIDDTRSLDILDLYGYGSKNNRGFRYVLVVIDNFSKFGCTIVIRNKNAQTKTNFFENMLKSDRRKPNLVGTDDG